MNGNEYFICRYCLVMVGVLVSSDQCKEISSKEYRSNGDGEKEIEQIIIQYPDLLRKPDDLPVCVVGEQVKIKGDNQIDILLVDKKGLPIIVEVKLHDNKESNREVCGQILDYASTLNQMDYRDLSEKTRKNLDRVLRSFSHDESGFRRIKDDFVERLKSGAYRLIIAVDKVHNDLLKTWLYTNYHSQSLDLRLIAIECYDLGDGTKFFAPHHLISNDYYMNFSSGNSNPRLSEIAESFRSFNIPDLAIKKNIQHDSCKINVNFWPDHVDYEFKYWKNEDYLSVELMAELKPYRKLEDIMFSFEERMSSLYPREVQFKNGGNYKGWIRLQICKNPNSDPHDIALVMKTLIESTKDELQQELLRYGYIK